MPWGHGPLVSLLDDLLTFWPEGSSGLLTCDYCLVIGTGGQCGTSSEDVSMGSGGSAGG